MPKVIAYENTEGQLCVVHPTGEIPFSEVLLKDVPAGARYVITDNDKLPKSREFREAWALGADSAFVTVDIPKAKELTKDRLRIERAPLLEALDVQYVRALEEGRDTSAIVAEKNRLRDITKAADDAKSLEELRTLSALVQKG